jgi:hypothetical protein
MFSLPNGYEPTKEDLLTEIRELHFEMSVMQERMIQQYQMIAELSNLVIDITDYVNESVEDIYKQSNRQAKLHEEVRKKRNAK